MFVEFKENSSFTRGRLFSLRHELTALRDTHMEESRLCDHLNQALDSIAKGEGLLYNKYKKPKSRRKK